MADRLEQGNAVLQTIHASEGGRALKLLQERQKRKQEIEQARKEIESEARKSRLGRIDEKYKGSSTEAFEEAFKQDTVGLVTAEQFREKRKRLAEKIEEDIAAAAAAEAAKASSDSGHDIKVQRRRGVPERSRLSFKEALSDNDGSDHGREMQKLSNIEMRRIASELERTEEASSHIKRKYFGKDPSVDTSFLSDAEREERLRRERERIVQEYRMEQERIKEELLDITYSYWDGVGHKRSQKIKIGSTIGAFLEESRKFLAKEFHELATMSSEELLYVQDGIILPPTVTFYELIKTQARGRSGSLLFHKSATTSKSDSSIGKVVDRRWYEKNKHVFLVSGWTHYNPGKTYDKNREEVEAVNALL